MRIHLFEFEDQSWFPNDIRESMTDFLRYFLKATHFYQPIALMIAEVLKQTGENTIIDLGSGGGGAIETVHIYLKRYSSLQIKILLTDKFPNISAFEYLENKTKGEIGYSPLSIDATNVPKPLKGFRSMYSTAHHFKPDVLKQILKNAADSNESIGLFDGGNKSIFTIVGILILQPILFVVFTPFFKPFKWSRLWFTYLIPIIPFCTMWDGVVSIMRLYQPLEFLKIAKETVPHYTWQAGKVKNKIGMKVCYLIGYNPGMTTHGQG